MKIPQIIAAPPDWLAFLLSIAFGAMWIAAAIGMHALTDSIK